MLQLRMKALFFRSPFLKLSIILWGLYMRKLVFVWLVFNYLRNLGYISQQEVGMLNKTLFKQLKP